MKQLKKELENVLEKELDQKQYKYIYNAIYYRIKSNGYKMKNIYWIENEYGFFNKVILVYVKRIVKAPYYYYYGRFRINLKYLPTYE